MTDQPSTSRSRSDRPIWVGVDPDEDDRRPPPLTRARIVRAALRLVDDQGISALTMRALATDLRVSPMALYNHVRDKDELLDLMLDLMLGEVDCSATDGDWLTQLRALVCSFHEVLSAHHHLARIYSAQVKIGPHGLCIIERAITLLLEAGFSRRDAADAFQTLYTYTVGLHLVGRVAPSTGPTAPDEAEYYDALPPEKIPSIQAVRAYLGNVHRRGLFEYGLDALLAGLQTKLLATEAAARP
ncbi:MAG TPA: TetR/AcrR family transcriptional regulator C-terminal domain-containing protein [Pseudonocardiaceae bacterium]|nr:TetR/AcrR family transcriptional regulator C-terminal domain-containing protein [Pseudonocardiaceae bacterium]